MPIIEEFTLIDTNLYMAKILAELKINRNKKAGAKSTYYGSAAKNKQIDEETNNSAGEIAYSNIRRINMDFSTNPRKGGADFIERDGMVIDVKTNRYSFGDLNVKPTKEHVAKGHCDYYALITGWFYPNPVYQLRGWIREEDIIRPERWRTHFSTGIKMPEPCYSVSQDELLLEYPGEDKWFP